MTIGEAIREQIRQTVVVEIPNKQQRWRRETVRLGPKVKPPFPLPKRIWSELGCAATRSGFPSPFVSATTREGEAAGRATEREEKVPLPSPSKDGDRSVIVVRDRNIWKTVMIEVTRNQGVWTRSYRCSDGLLKTAVPIAEVNDERRFVVVDPCKVEKAIAVEVGDHDMIWAESTAITWPYSKGAVAFAEEGLNGDIVASSYHVQSPIPVEVRDSYRLCEEPA